ncbi:MULTISPECIES: nucleoid occlusion protein [unclassified Paenibacillus]|uniref:nucleoid occlusion protein n=1 Tax=unclassified Paenibacillus TaxID=185978 RepID=UPI00076D42CC|nr:MULTISPECIES: nucleoid occlusion protein [unclassified Paenibacillus]KUP20839.1 nucleoid occlusion protein [Paenibacillus sp. DMB5]MDF9846282.1 ParB family chromosome partitioning protein [Paenibacillus sp. PastM-2]MDF9853368.1 ParB family chromosome partitioning protein [Paenibacillus sp. PastF-1]MDH6478128.1 ParB family chromosome partitioning protein [Paenibacillus sp. PastH-2]MDH6506373.1 ParB family chromosome partitioning protein [Paenibacillus sp. PastM-3]
MKEQFTKLFGFSERSSGEEVKQIPVHEVISSPYQPRTIFDDEKIDELCQTIKTHGVIQPIVVRVRDSQYEIIAGERRWRAVKKLGLDTVPAIVREFNDSQAASIALIENLQREGLTSIEEAIAYQKLIDLHQLTQESLAQRLGKSQSTIANKIRLLQLPEEVKTALMERQITERHARSLLSLDSVEMQLKVLAEIISKELNVKQTEARIAFYKALSQTAKKSKRVSYTKDVRLALNTIRQSIDMVTGSGMEIKTSENDRGDHYEIVIQIPKR